MTGRKNELQSLERVYSKKGFRMTVIYGRRRVGKSTLICEFIRDKRAVYYVASKVGMQRNTELFSKQVVSVLSPEFENASFKELEDVFSYITRKIKDEKLVIVIDELPYWADREGRLLTTLQKFADTEWKDLEIMLILCGSSLSFMDDEVLSEKSPLFGRRDSQIKLEPFTYKEAALFTPDYSDEDKAVCYGITGGIAKYLSMIDTAKTLDSNIKELFFRPDGYLYDEPRNFITQEFSDIVPVNNIIEQIATGKTTVNEIALGSKQTEPSVMYTLEKLVRVGLVEKRRCVTEESNRKKTQYILRDHMLRFWYRFIPPATSVIEMDRGEAYYDLAVKPVLHSYMGSVFEDMCRYYILERGTQGEFGNYITVAGTWWGMEKLRDDEREKISVAAEIDIVGISLTDRTAVVGECKFRNEKIDKSILDILKRRAAVISQKYYVKKYILFSLSGFSDWFDKNKDENVLLYTLHDLYSDC